MMIAIDPGTRAVGWAIFLPDGSMHRCGLAHVKGTNRVLADDAIELADQIGVHLPRVVLEEMVMRPEDPRSQADDLLRVQLVGGIVAARVGQKIVTVRPMRWKGCVPKRIHHRRIGDVMTRAEKDLLTAACRTVHRDLQHNVIDAIGIGLWDVGRLPR